MPTFNPEVFGRAMRAAIVEAVAPLREEIAALKAAPAPKDGSDGQDGASVTLEDVRPMVEDLVRQAVSEIPAASDGEDGKDCDMDAVMARVEELVKAIPPAKDGVDGKDGAPGADGKDAEPVSEAAIADAVAARFERRFSDLVLSWERQARDEIQKALDKMPAPKDGKDGKDAAPIESFEVSQNERTLTLKLGDVERTVKLDAIIDRGVWKQGGYEKGDAVTWAGSLWIAQADTEEAPGAGKSWRLAVKKGRDGKDLRDTASKHDKSKGVDL